MPTPNPTTNLEGTLKMLDGRSIPMFGLGVYMMSDEETYNSCKWALEAGYKHIDTAEWYENESMVGKALNEYLGKTGGNRSDIFVTSKLKRNRTYDSALADLKSSLKRTGVDYFDLYLMHSAIGGPQVRKEVWRAFCDAKKEGLIKSIGVSNFGSQHIQEFVDRGYELPVLNQIDLHPFMRHPEIVEICEKHGILLEAWGPLARGMRFDHPSILKASKKHNKDVAQIFLRWGLQHGFVIIPKTVSRKRVVSNAEIFDFELDEADMEDLDRRDEHLVTDWDVVDVE